MLRRPAETRRPRDRRRRNPRARSGRARLVLWCFGTRFNESRISEATQVLGDVFVSNKFATWFANAHYRTRYPRSRLARRRGKRAPSETSVASGVPTPPLASISCVPGGLGISWGICRTIVPLSSRARGRGARDAIPTAQAARFPRGRTARACGAWSLSCLLILAPAGRRGEGRSVREGMRRGISAEGHIHV